MEEPLYVAKPPLGGLYFLLGILAACLVVFWTVIFTALLVSGEWFGGVMLAFGWPVFAMSISLIAFRFEVYADRLLIVFPFTRWSIPFDSINELRPAAWWKVFYFHGANFVSLPGLNSILRTRASKPSLLMRVFFPGPEILISAHHHAEFIDALNKARVAYAERAGRGP